MIALRHLASQRPVQGAAAVAIAATLLAASAAVAAIRLEPAPTPLPEASTSVATLQNAAGTPNELIDEAVAASPFTPSRQQVAAVPASPDAAPSYGTQAITLVGTVVGDDGDSFVLVASGNGPAKVVRVGGLFEGHRLRSIGQASAVFTNVQTGERLELRVPRSR
jgi:hypothetical protein